MSWPAITGVLGPLRGGVWTEKTRFRVGVRGIGVAWFAADMAALVEELRVGEPGRDSELIESSSASSLESIVEKVALACSRTVFSWRRIIAMWTTNLVLRLIREG